MYLLVGRGTDGSLKAMSAEGDTGGVNRAYSAATVTDSAGTITVDNTDLVWQLENQDDGTVKIKASNSKYLGITNDDNGKGLSTREPNYGEFATECRFTFGVSTKDPEGFTAANYIKNTEGRSISAYIPQGASAIQDFRTYTMTSNYLQPLYLYKLAENEEPNKVIYNTVNADPQPGAVDKTANVTLTVNEMTQQQLNPASQGAVGESVPASSIKYTLNGGAEQTYTDPIPLSGYAGQTVSIVARAVWDGLGESVPKTFKYEVNPDVSEIAAVRSAKGGKFAVEGVITFINGKNVVVQDATGGINLYLKTNLDTNLYRLGDKIRAVGTRSEYNGLEQLTGAAVTGLVQQGYGLPTPWTTTIGSVLQNPDTYESQRVTISGLTLGNTVSNKTVFTLENFYITAFKAPALSSAVGDLVTVTAVLGDNNGAELRIADAGDVVTTTVAGGSVADAELLVGGQPLASGSEIEIGSTVTFVSETYGADFEYKLGNEVQYIKYDGGISITGNAGDTLTITVRAYLGAAKGTDKVYTYTLKDGSPVVPVYDPIPDEVAAENGAKNIAEVLEGFNGGTLTGKVKVVGQLAYRFGNADSINSAVIQDVVGNKVVGLQLYNALPGFEIGDILVVEGTLADYGKVTQLTGPTATKLNITAGPIPAQEVTAEQLSANPGDYVSEYVVLKNMTIGAYNKEGTTLLTDEGGNSIGIYKGASLPANVTEGAKINVYGVFSRYNTTLQLRVGGSDSYKLHGAAEVDTSVTVPVASWDGSGVKYTTTEIPGDRDNPNDMLDASAKLTVSTGSIPLYEVNATYCIGSKGLSAGQYYQMAFPLKGYGALKMNFTMRGSNTGAKYFNILYSTDGTNFQKLTGMNYSISTYDYSTSTTKTDEFKNVDYIQVYTDAKEYSVEFPQAVSNAETVYIRMQVQDNTSIKGGTIGTGGVNRFLGINFTASPVVSDDMSGYVKVKPAAGEIPLGTALELTTSTAGAEIWYSVNSSGYQLYNPDSRPVLSVLPATVRVYSKKAGISDSITMKYAYTQAKTATPKASPNGGAVKPETPVKLTCETEGAVISYSFDGGASWTPYTGSLKLTSLPAELSIKAQKEGYLDSEVKTVAFTQRENDDYNIYFGQLHSHTQYSDGAGTCEDAFTYASTEAEHVDFLAVTDHSDKFDNDTSATIKDGSASSEWVEGHMLADKVTADNTKKVDGKDVTDFVGIYGYEMTWSGGAPGHINTFNTEGFMSRNMPGYDSLLRSSLQNYYGELKTVPESISMFNHPGTTFGDFFDFAYYDNEIDPLITLIEVGNGEGAIGSSGYFPSYEYYTRALDKGWHVAPANNQDNHKGRWGDSNTGRTVILADSLTRENVYDAVRNMRTYATEDNDLKIWYTLNGFDMGTIFEEAPDTVQIKVRAEDPTDAVIGKVEIIVNGGLVAASGDIASNLGELEFNLDPAYSYYYVRIIQQDGDIAVTAPVWINEVEALGIGSITTGSSLQVMGEPINIETTFFNNEATAFNVNSIVYTIDGEVIGTVNLAEAGLTTISPMSEPTYSFNYTHNGMGETKVTVTMLGDLNGYAKQYTDVLTLNYITPEMVTKVVIDGTHYNDYVTGYYAGNTGNFADIAANEFVQVNVVTDRITPEILEDCSLLVVSSTYTYYKADADKPYKTFEPEFVEMLKNYAAGGGNIIFCGIADYNDSDRGSNSDEINKLLGAIGATTRLNSDELVDDVNNGGQNYRLYFNKFNKDSKYTQGIAEGQEYSAYSACGVLLDPDAVAAGKAEGLVFGHDTTYSIDSKRYDNNYVETPKGTIVAMAHETLDSGSEIFVAGTVFLSDFEVKNELDNIWDTYYANRNILLNILKDVQKDLPVSTIAQMRAGNAGDVFTIEGYVTAGTAVEGNIFFDAIYVQDDTAGTTVFPVSELGIAVGAKLRITGFVDGYQGDKEIQVIKYEVLNNEAPKVYQPKAVTTEKAMDYNAYGGSLLEVTGQVTRIVTNSAGVDYFFVKDSSGAEARVFIDGYILASDGSDTVNSDVKVGNTIKAAGLLYMNPDGACLRVRDRAEVVLVSAGNADNGNANFPETPEEEDTEEVSEETDSEWKDAKSIDVKDLENIDEIAGLIEKLPDGGKVVLNMMGAEGTKLSTEILEAALKSNVDIKIKVSENVSWVIKGGSETGTIPGPIDFGVILNYLNVSESGPVDGEQHEGSETQHLIDAYKKLMQEKLTNARKTLDNEEDTDDRLSDILSGSTSLILSLGHDGVFGISAELEIKTGAEKGKVAILFYFNPETRKLEFAGASYVGEKGLTRLQLSHASDYVLVFSDEFVYDEALLDQISVTPEGSKTLYYGETPGTKQIRISIPEEISNAVKNNVLVRNISYESSDPSVVDVTFKRKMVAKGPGKAVVTVTVNISGKERVFKINVTVKERKTASK